MKIAVVHNLPPGGARRRLASQVAWLQGDVLEFCLSSADPISDAPCVVAYNGRAARAPQAARPPLRYLDQFRLESAWRELADEVRRSRPDVVFMNPCRFLQTPPIVGSLGAPTLYFCDEPRRVDHEAAAKRTRSKLTWPVYAGLYRRTRQLDIAAVRRATLVATNSRYTAAQIQRAYGRTADVVVMGVEEQLISMPLEPSDGYLLSVGALLPAKGHDLVIRVGALVRPTRSVVVVSPRPDSAESARLEQLASELGVPFEIRVAVADTELAALYARAHATLYLSRLEPLGLASLEAQAAGCPVIVSAEGGLPETIVESVTGWAVPRDPAPVARCLEQLDQRGVRARMSEACKSESANRTWRVSAAHIGRLLGAASTRAARAG